MRSLEFKQAYRSDVDDIAREFLGKALSHADFYDRAAGFFTSSALIPLSRGLEDFVRSPGYIRLVVSPQLTEADVEAIESGYAARDSIIENRLAASVEQMELTADRHSFGLLTWLVAHRRLDIRVATPERPGAGIYHEKFGIVGDSDSAIAFSGSLNETGAAYELNFESIDVYCSWLEPRRVALKRKAFEQLWENQTPKITVVKFPEALRKRLLISAPSSVPGPRPPNTRFTNIELRGYQEAAIQAWRSNNFCGILSMATGTGKTKTALECINLAAQDGSNISIVLAPLKHLCEQWADELRTLLSNDVIVCNSDHDWKSTLPLAVRRAKVKTNGDGRRLSIVATYDTAESSEFQKFLPLFGGNTLFVADEMHNITRARADVLLIEHFEKRLGLSATPERYLDEAASKAVIGWFHGIVFTYTLGQAIDNSFLTPYQYLPKITHLTDAESFEYDQLIKEVEALSNEPSVSVSERRRRISILLTKRESLLERSSEKLRLFGSILASDDVRESTHNLVYVHPEYLDVVQHMIGRENHLTNHRFTAGESTTERKEILSDFASGRYAFLIAIRCLDEGVDIPATKNAFILNSSANPKEFVQRRGRVLRLWPQKVCAKIYDFVVLPRRIVSKRDESLVTREYSRFREFADLAINRNQALRELDEQWAKLRNTHSSH